MLQPVHVTTFLTLHLTAIRVTHITLAYPSAIQEL